MNGKCPRCGVMFDVQATTGVPYLPADDVYWTIKCPNNYCRAEIEFLGADLKEAYRAGEQWLRYVRKLEKT
jgi:hypothetical protein